MACVKRRPGGKRHLRHTTHFALVATLFTIPQFAAANIIIDPDGVGATYVTGTGTPIGGDPTTQQVRVGGFSMPGVLEINADDTCGGVSCTALDRSGLLVGDQTAFGEVRIIGDGSAMSAYATINDGIGARIGFGGQGTLKVQQGGALLSTENIHFGEDSINGDKGSSTVMVDGPNSLVSASISPSGDGGRVYMPFGYSDLSVTVTNGGRIEAVGGSLADYEEGAIYVGDEGSHPVVVVIDVVGENSVISAQHGIYVRHAFGSTSLNATDGGRIEVLDDDTGSPYAFPSVAINALDGNASINVSGESLGGVASRLDAAGDIQIGAVRAIAGFTASGKPSYFYDSGITAGAQVLSDAGEPLFDQNGAPVIGVEETIFYPGGSYSYVQPSSYTAGNEIHVRADGHVSVTGGAILSSGGDIHVSQNDGDPVLPSYSGNDSTLTVNDATVQAQHVYVNAGGLLKGSNGLIVADVVVDGGTLAPGSSPGTLEIDGNLDVLTGTLELEADSPMLMDLLVVSGDVNIGPDAVIELVLGYVPTVAGIDIGDFFDVAGAFNVDPGFDALSSILLAFTTTSGVQEGDMVDVMFGDRLLTFEYVNGQARVLADDGSVPVPPTLLLLLAGLFVARRAHRLAA